MILREIKVTLQSCIVAHRAGAGMRRQRRVQDIIYVDMEAGLACAVVGPRVISDVFGNAGDRHARRTARNRFLLNEVTSR